MSKSSETQSFRNLGDTEIDRVAGGLAPISLVSRITLGEPLNLANDERRKLLEEIRNLNRALPNPPGQG